VTDAPQRPDYLWANWNPPLEPSEFVKQIKAYIEWLEQQLEEYKKFSGYLRDELLEGHNEEDWA